MGAGLVAVGAGASLLQSGIGAFQAYNAKQAQDKAYRDLQNMPKPENAYANVRIGNEAYAAQEAKNSQTEANLVQSLQDMGTTAALGGIPVVQQQADIANADITAKKAAELQRLEVAKAEQQQKINDDYLNYKRQ